MNRELVPPPHGEVHVWHVDLDRDALPGFAGPDFPAVLSKDEQARAARFAFEPDRRRWAAGRAALRLLLGRYLGAAPDTLLFDAGIWGKPSVPHCPLRFNVTHSGGHALLAFAWKQEVGVDLEWMQPDLEADELAPQVFSERECAWLREYAPERRNAAFLTLWTAKEAYVKALGQGLSFPLRRLSLRLEPSSDEFRADQLVSLSPIFVRRIDAGPNSFAALALEGTPAVVRYFGFPNEALDQPAENQHCCPGV